MKNFTFFLLFLISLNSFSQNFSSGTKINILNNNIIKSSKNNAVDSLINICISEINQDSIKTSIKHLQDFGTRYLLSPNRKSIALWLQNKFISIGLTNTIIDSFRMVTHMPNGLANDTSIQYNVIATLTGIVNPNSVYIVGAHYDDITYVDPMIKAPGADDDASGVAASLEIARVIKKIGYAPEATIKFVAFAGEEAMILYCDTSGSQHYAADAVKRNENIEFFVSNDMISNCTSTSNWSIEIRNHDPSSPLVKLAENISTNFTSITPINVFQSQYGADEYPFFAAGFPAIFMQEAEYSPNWHMESDTLGNYNMSYCAEASKISAGMLIAASETPSHIKKLFITNPGDGHTLIPSWKPNTETDLAGYKVFIGKNSNAYDTVFITTDTSYVFNNLQNDSLYFIGVSAFNTKGNSSIIVEKSDAPGIATLSNGILIIKDSKGGISSPTDQQLDDFYNQICDGFMHSQYDAAATNKISMEIIGKYSSLIWYVNNKSWASSVLKDHEDLLINYLRMGGHILFSLYKPSKFIENKTSNTSVYNRGTFIYDYANILMTKDTAITRFSGANAVLPFQSSMIVDTLKLPSSNMPFVEALSPTENGNTLLLYDSKYDSTSGQGYFKNKPVGIENKDADKNIITLSFPLYYMDEDQAKAFIFHTMTEKFHENYSGIEKNKINDNSEITIKPNPSNGQITIIFDQKEVERLQLFSTSGNLVYESNGKVKNFLLLNLSSYPKGFYILKMLINDEIFARKIILQ